MLPGVAFGQITTVGDAQETPIPGTPHDYVKLLSETVNPANGSLSLRLNLPVPAGRGLTLPFAITYDSSGVHTPYQGVGQGEWSSDISFISQGGWSYSIPQLTYQFGSTGSGGSECYFTDAFLFTDASGGRHSFGKMAGSQNANGQNGCAPSSKLTGADDYVQAVLSAGYEGKVIYVLVADADGTVYHFSSSGQEEPAPNGSTIRLIPDWIEDRNGNQITITNPGSGAFTMTDTAGRAITSSGFETTGNTVSADDLSYGVTWTTASSTFSPNADWITGTGDSYCRGFSGVSGVNQNEIGSISVPGEGTYTFTYDTGNSGLLKSITYPSGGSVSYTWGYSSTQNEYALFADTQGASNCGYLYNTFVITSRTVNFNAGIAALKQTFSYSTSWSGSTWSSKSTTVTTQDMLRTGQPSYKTIYTYNGQYSAPNPSEAVQWNATQVPVEQSVVKYDWGQATILETDTEGWLDQYELGCETVTMGSSGPTRGVFYAYGPGAQITDKKEYDYGGVSSSQCINGATAPSGPLRETQTSYCSVSPTTAVFPTASVFDRPLTIEILGSGSKVAQTTYQCDVTALQSTSSVENHDYTNYSTSNNNRGNTTLMSKWVNTSGGSLTWNYKYDDTGQMLSAADPKGNSTGYSYADSYQGGCGTPPANPTNAYLTTM